MLKMFEEIYGIVEYDRFETDSLGDFLDWADDMSAVSTFLEEIYYDALEKLKEDEANLDDGYYGGFVVVSYDGTGNKDLTVRFGVYANWVASTQSHESILAKFYVTGYRVNSKEQEFEEKRAGEGDVFGVIGKLTSELPSAIESAVLGVTEDLAWLAVQDYVLGYEETGESAVLELSDVDLVVIEWLLDNDWIQESGGDYVLSDGVLR